MFLARWDGYGGVSSLHAGLLSAMPFPSRRLLAILSDECGSIGSTRPAQRHTTAAPVRRTDGTDGTGKGCAVNPALWNWVATARAACARCCRRLLLYLSLVTL